MSDETKGTILRAENGDVIRYDETGVSLRLSDRVVEDMALRLGLGAPPPETPAPPAPPSGLDAWDARWAGDWLLFQARLPGAQGPRGFRQHRDGGAILAQAPGPVLGLLEMGGPSAALADPGAPRFPYHILAPADDIGAVGLGGIEPAEPRATLEPLRERTHGALVAEALLDQALATHAPLPLFLTRAETQAAATAADLAQGMALANLMTAADSLALAGARLGQGAEVLAVCLDYALEDLSPTPAAYRDGMLALIEAISAGLWARGFRAPPFVMRAESPLADLAPPALEGQWELAWNHGAHDLRVSAPGYMFARDAHDRPTPARGWIRRG